MRPTAFVCLSGRGPGQNIRLGTARCCGTRPCPRLAVLRICDAGGSGTSSQALRPAVEFMRGPVAGLGLFDAAYGRGSYGAADSRARGFQRRSFSSLTNAASHLWLGFASSPPRKGRAIAQRAVLPHSTLQGSESFSVSTTSDPAEPWLDGYLVDCWRYTLFILTVYFALAHLDRQVLAITLAPIGPPSLL